MGQEPIAIIGIGCRFPSQAVSPALFWRLLVDGVDTIREIPPDRFDLSDVYDSDPSVPGKTYSRWGAFVDGIDQFDPGFFGFSRREAVRIDPQHRMLLETAWEAFEDARLPAERLAGSATGVFVGISTHDYPDIQAYPGNRALIDAHTNSGGAVSIASNRISYVYDLRGPSFSVDTACSSSLVATHLACQSLWNGESDLALVGGVQAVLTPEVSIGFSKASMLSPDGRCKAFAAEANGYVRGEGAGVLLLKPLGRALADGDRIYALIRGSAINEDGRTNGMTVPSLSAQQAVLRDAYRRSEVHPGDVHYVEAHGTGTVVGDPIEAEALGSVLACHRPAGEVLRIGSVKTNIGHLEAASGIAGLIKAVLTLHHRWIPPSLHANNPSPAIPFADLRVRVVTAGEAWPDDAPAFAGVNSFGFGGANAHVVLEGAPRSNARSATASAATQEAPAGDDRTELLIVSAKSPASLQRLAREYRDSLLASGAPPLADLAAAAAIERTHHDFRLGVVGRDREAVADNLDAFVNGESRADVVSGRAPHGDVTRIVFVFTGMGPPWWGMARSLLTSEPVFRSVIDECDRLFRRYGTWSLVAELMADEAHSRVSGAELAPASNFAVQAGLLALWKSWGRGRRPQCRRDRVGVRGGRARPRRRRAGRVLSRVPPAARERPRRDDGGRRASRRPATAARSLSGTGRRRRGEQPDVAHALRRSRRDRGNRGDARAAPHVLPRDVGRRAVPQSSPRRDPGRHARSAGGPADAHAGRADRLRGDRRVDARRAVRCRLLVAEHSRTGPLC
jgi:acyl transferase domain-containing protein